MKTTLEIPDTVSRRAKARVAEAGIPLRQFSSAAVAEKLEAKPAIPEKEWMKLADGLRHLKKETARINARIEEAFEHIEPEDGA